jgi:hypothetical protein
MPDDLLSLLDLNNLLITIIGMVLLITCTTGSIIGLTFFIISRVLRPNQYVLDQGLSGEATILSIKGNGVRMGARYGFRLQLEVRLPGYPVYEARARTLINIADLPRYQNGESVAVRVHPEDRSKVELDMKAQELT